MLPKAIRDRRREGKKTLSGMKRVFKLMETDLDSNDANAICVASAFLTMLSYHMIEGQLSETNIHLATLLRGDGSQEDI